MYALVRPLAFTLSPASAHAAGMAVLGPLEHVAPLREAVRALLRVGDPRLATRVLGLDFATPVGLAAGFDKNARRARALASLGFGHVELGTVTARPQAPNPAPNLFRLPGDRALVNRLGFPNDGARGVCARIARVKGEIGAPVGVSIGKSRAVGIEPIEPAIADYLESFAEARAVADFVVVNVSSPNTKDLRAMQGTELARALLSAIASANGAPGGPRRVPLLVKIAPDLGDAELEALLEVVEGCGIDGVVATNTTVARRGLRADAAAIDAIGAGGLSGEPLRARSLEVVARVRARLGKKFAVVGVGGVSRAEHAAAMLRAGADLVQIYTGFVYEGPGAASAIARGLVETLDRERLASIRDLAPA